MVTVAIVCPHCQRVVALGAELPAVCFGALTPEERATLTPTQLDAHPKAHRDCVELEVAVPDEFEPETRLAEVQRMYHPQLAALGELAPHMQSER